MARENDAPQLEGRISMPSRARKASSGTSRRTSVPTARTWSARKRS